MLAIGASVEQIQPWIRGREAEVSIATVNGPHSVVISGVGEAVLAVGELAQSMGRQTKELEVSHAFHSPLMDPILDELTRVAASMRISHRIPIYPTPAGFLREFIG
jgi:acyl transferase domain-containing protein